MTSLEPRETNNIKQMNQKHPFHIKRVIWDLVNQAGKGHYYENQNIENQKEHRKKFKASEHRKCLFSSSLLRHHYIKKHLYSSSLHRKSVSF